MENRQKKNDGFRSLNSIQTNLNYLFYNNNKKS